MGINGWLSESHSGGSAVEDSVLKTESQHKLTRTYGKNQLSKWRERQGTWGKKGGELRAGVNRLGKEIDKTTGSSH